MELSGLSNEVGEERVAKKGGRKDVIELSADPNQSPARDIAKGRVQIIMFISFRHGISALFLELRRREM